jgi:phage host-nuclease inhibitor protein Gam
MKASLRVPLAVSAIVPFIFAVALAQSDAPKGASKADAKAADKSDAKSAKPRAKPRGRVPAYYNQVIDGQKREKIYAIQQSYDPKISALKAELQALQDKLDAEVEAVLTPDQLTKVKALAEEAKQ